MNSVKPHNLKYVDSTDQFANASPMQLAIREVQSTASSPRFWIGLAAVILVLAITAPFDTGSRFSFPVLLVYWGTIAVCSFFIALPVSVFVITWCELQSWLSWICWLLGGVVAGLPVTVFVVVFNRVFFNLDPIADHGFVNFYVECTLIAIAIVIVDRLISAPTSTHPGTEQSSAQLTTELTSRQQSPTSTDQPHIIITSFHRRLSPEIGNDIICLQSQDHYVDVTTSNGHELILMRLSDAEKELETFPGLRVHRSWWVALNHVVAVERQSGRVIARLDNEVCVPVSRNRVGELRNQLTR